MLANTATASARTIDVFPGHSIQAAVNRAHSGDVIDVHPGVYQGSVAIKKDDLALRGAGDANGGTVIKPRAHTRRCGHGHSGICISRHRNANGHLVATAGTRISDLRVEGFRDFGAVAQGAKDTIFRDNSFVHNNVYGVAAFGSQPATLAAACPAFCAFLRWNMDPRFEIAVAAFETVVAACPAAWPAAWLSDPTVAHGFDAPLATELGAYPEA